MRISALLFAAAILTAAAAAQSSSQLATPRDSRNQPPAMTVTTFTANKTSSSVVVLKPSGSIRVAGLQTPCYAIRAYNFPAGSASEVTKSTGITTCERVRDSGFHAAVATPAR